jgi:MFS family permease
MTSEAEALARAITKAAWRLIPFLLLLYVLAFLDRANVGFAKQALQRDTGLSEGAYAFGAGLFFVGYAVLEVPSNLLLFRFGARVWMSRIMVTWGLTSAAMMFAWNETVFCVLRFLLGVAEAGFFPGVIFYFTFWFPSATRGKMMGLFYFGAPLALIFGGPLSGLLLELNGLGDLKGWQWMFLVEGVLAAGVGLWAYWYLDGRPAEAAWLSREEKAALHNALEAEAQRERGPVHFGVLRVLVNHRVLYFGLIYCLIQMSVYGVTFYLPAQVAMLLRRETGLTVGLVTAAPWLCALVAAYAVPRLAGRTGRRRWVGGVALAAAGCGIAISATGRPGLALAALCVAAAGFISVQPVFWTFPTDELRGAAAAAGIALINSCGAVGGFFAPNVKTLAERTLASATAGYLVLAWITVLGAILIFVLPERARVKPEGSTSNVKTGS